MQSLVDERVRQREHHGDVGARHEREPLGVDEPGQVVAQRAEQHELGAARRAAARRWSRAGCRLAPPGLTIVFLIGMPPKQTKSSVCARAPTTPSPGPGTRASSRRRAAGSPTARRAVGVLAAHVAAEAVEEAVELALRVVEAAGAAPAVGAAEDALAPVPRRRRAAARAASRSGAVAQLTGTNGSAPRRASGPGPRSSQPGADHRLRDPGAVPQAIDDVAEQRRGIGVVPIGMDRDDRRRPRPRPRRRPSGTSAARGAPCPPA